MDNDRHDNTGIFMDLCVQLLRKSHKDLLEK